MIIALFALSLAMIVGGIASVVQGFPFVRLESGLAMTIAGATTASAGAVLLGLSVLASQVRGLARRIAEAAAPAPPAAFTPREYVPHSALPDIETSDPKLQASRRPVIAGAGGLAAGAIGAASLGSADPRVRPDPTFEEPPAPAPAEPSLPDLLPPRDDATEGGQDVSQGKRHEGLSRPSVTQPDVASPAAEAEPETTDTDLFAHYETPALRPALEEAADTPPTSTAPSDEASVPVTTPTPADTIAAGPALEVVGTYVSGGNTYVMFSDGSIEAETPRGRFTFESLEELKAFVEAGGEGETRGVA